MVSTPSAHQLKVIEITERVCSAISLTGTTIIIFTFIASCSFRKPITYLVFYASWGNIMANIATMISQDGNFAGSLSSLCQFQAFVIQWLLPADALWTLAMACNVYLTFFYNFNSDQLRRIEWIYAIVCYGLPFIPAFTFFFVHTHESRVYGVAVLWCWISRPWAYFRVATFYAPIWFIMLLITFIYIRAGNVIYKNRQRLRSFRNIRYIDSETQPETPCLNITGIQVTRDISYTDPQPNGCESHVWTVTIQGGPYEPVHVFRASSPPEKSTNAFTTAPEPSSSHAETVAPSSGSSDDSIPKLSLNSSHTENTSNETKIPVQGQMLNEASSASWAYTKYAMLFFIAMLVTWVPSTCNRIYAIARPNDFCFPLNYAAGFVLPLQGFWNCLIYISISWPAFKAIWAKVKKRITAWTALLVSKHNRKETDTVNDCN